MSERDPDLDLTRLEFTRQEFTQQEFTRQAGAISRSATFGDDRAIEPFLRLLREVGAPLPDRILDLACGPGIVSAALARAGAHVVGVDATPAMLEAARERFRTESLSGGEFHEAPAEALPFDEGAFPAAVTRLALHHFVDPGRVLRELRRVLTLGAPLVVGDIVSSASPAEADLHNALERLRDPSHQRCLTEDELVAGIEAAGFEVDQVEAWANARDFHEWAAIVDDAGRVEPVRVVMAALAEAGLHAGIDLRSSGDAIQFVHHWRFIRAVAR